MAGETCAQQERRRVGPANARTAAIPSRRRDAVAAAEEKEGESTRRRARVREGGKSADEVSRSATTHGSVFTRSAAIAALATAHTAAAAKTRMVKNVQRNHWQRDNTVQVASGKNFKLFSSIFSFFGFSTT